MEDKELEQKRLYDSLFLLATGWLLGWLFHESAELGLAMLAYCVLMKLLLKAIQVIVAQKIIR